MPGKKHSAETEKHSIGILFPILLFCVFTFCAVSVVLFAARIYEHSVESAEKNYSTGTALSYLSEKIRRNDADGAVTVGTLNGGDALILEGTGDYAGAETCIYLDDGVLRELFMKDGADIDPKAGDAIMDLAGFKAESVTANLIRLTVTDTSGNTAERLIAIRSGRTG